MNDELRAEFLVRFVAGARERLERASNAIAEGSSAALSIAADLHTIAGEASIMGLGEIVAVAREGEQALRSVAGLDDPSLLALLHKLSRGLDQLLPSSATKPKAGDCLSK